MKSESDRYGKVAITIHWLSVLLIIGLIGSGLRADDTEDKLAKVDILQVHIPLGIAILLLTLFRMGWWAFADKKPTPVPMSTLQERASRGVHFLFYVVILGMAASGIGMMILSGAGPIIFGAEASALPDFWDYKPRAPHGIGAKLIIALFVFHAGAVLYHHVFLQDGLLKRMWFRNDRIGN